MVRNEWISHPSAGMAAQQGASWLCREAGWVPLFKTQIHPCNGVSSFWWLHFSSFLNSLLCAAETQWHAYNQTIFSTVSSRFPSLGLSWWMVCLKLPPPTQIIPVFAVAILSLQRWPLLSRNRLAGILSTCAQDLQFALVNWVEVKGWLRLLNRAVALVHVGLMITQKQSVPHGWYTLVYLSWRRELLA